MNCKTFKKNLIYYLEDELSGIVNSELKDHLQHCQECSKLYEEKLQLRNAFVQYYKVKDNIHLTREFTGILNKNYYRNTSTSRLSFHIRRNKFNYMALTATIAFLIFAVPLFKNSYIYKNINESRYNKPLRATLDKEKGIETPNEISLGNNLDEKAKEINYRAYASFDREENGANIAVFDGNEFAGWLSDKEILVFIQKDEQIPSTYPYPTRGLAIFNFTSGQVSEFTGTSVSNFYGISTNKSYALYTEPKYIPVEDSSQETKDLESVGLLNYSMKILDIKNGSTSDFKTPINNKDAAYKWIDDDKILAVYPYESLWQIVNVSGEVLKEGAINGENYLALTGADVQFAGEKVKGKIYIKEAFGAPTKIVTIDIESKQTETLIYRDTAVWCTFQQGVMLFSNSQSSEEVIQSLDVSGSVLKEYPIGELANVEESVLSPDGRKLALAGNYGGWERKVMLLNLDTGELKDLLACGSIENLSWSSDGKRISLASRTSWETEPTSYLIELKEDN